MDTVLRNGLVVDGTGGPGVVTDVGIADGRIAVMGDLSDESASRHLAGLLNDPRCVLGLSDAGAHADQLCDAVFPTFLLGSWVRERQRVSLETAVWRLSGQPLQVMRIAGRGLIKEGLAADLVAFDPTTVDALPLERIHDLPQGGERLIGRSVGIEHVWVNGTAVRLDGKPADGAHPGQLLAARP